MRYIGQMSMIDGMQQELTRLQSELAEARKENERLKSRNTELSSIANDATVEAERLRVEKCDLKAENERLKGQQVDRPEPAYLPFAILEHEMKDLKRFHECVMDDEGYDVPKERMRRLAEIGLLHHVSASCYEHTIFGLSVLNGDFNTAPYNLAAKVAELEVELERLKRKDFSHERVQNDSLKLANKVAAEQISKLTEQVKVAIVAGAEYAFNTSGVNGGLTLCEEEVEQIFDKLKGE